MTVIFWILGVLCVLGFILSLAARPRSGGGMFLFASVGILTWLSLNFGLGLWWTVPLYTIAALAFGSLWRSTDNRRGNQIAASLSILALLVGAIGAYVVGYQDGAEAGGKAAAVAAMDKPAATQQFKGSMVKDSNGNMVAVPDGTGTAAGRDNSWKQDFANNPSSDCLVGGVKGVNTEQQMNDLLNKLRHNAFCLSVVAKAAEVSAMKGRDVNDIGWLVSPAENGTEQYMSREGRDLHGDVVKFYESAKLSQTTAAAAGTNTGRNEAGNFQSAGISGTPESRKALTATAPNGAEVTVLLRCGNVAFAPGAQVLPSGHTDSLPPRPQKTPPTGGGPAPTPSKPSTPVVPPTTPPTPPVTTLPSTPPTTPPTTAPSCPPGTVPPKCLVPKVPKDNLPAPSGHTLAPAPTDAPESSLPKETNPINPTVAPTAEVTGVPAPGATMPPTSREIPPPVIPVNPDIPIAPPATQPGTSIGDPDGAPAASAPVVPSHQGGTDQSYVAPSGGDTSSCTTCSGTGMSNASAPAGGTDSGASASASGASSLTGNGGAASAPSAPAAESALPVDTTSVVEKALTRDEDNGTAVAGLATLVLAVGFGALFTRRSKVTA